MLRPRGGLSILLFRTFASLPRARDAATAVPLWPPVRRGECADGAKLRTPATSEAIAPSGKESHRPTRGGMHHRFFIEREPVSYLGHPASITVTRQARRGKDSCC